MSNACGLTDFIYNYFSCHKTIQIAISYEILMPNSLDEHHLYIMEV